MAVNAPAFQTRYIGWLIAVLIILICLLGVLGIVPADAKMMFALVGALALAVFFG